MPEPHESHIQPAPEAHIAIPLSLIRLTVVADGTVIPKPFETGGLHDGLRVIRSGLAPIDKAVIDGVVRVRPGAKVTPVAGSITSHPDGDGNGG